MGADPPGKVRVVLQQTLHVGKRKCSKEAVAVPSRSPQLTILHFEILLNDQVSQFNSKFRGTIVQY